MVAACAYASARAHKSSTAQLKVLRRTITRPVPTEESFVRFGVMAAPYVGPQAQLVVSWRLTHHNKGRCILPANYALAVIELTDAAFYLS